MACQLGELLSQQEAVIKGIALAKNQLQITALLPLQLQSLCRHCQRYTSLTARMRPAVSTCRLTSLFTHPLLLDV